MMAAPNSSYIRRYIVSHIVNAQVFHMFPGASVRACEYLSGHRLYMSFQLPADFSPKNRVVDNLREQILYVVQHPSQMRRSFKSDQVKIGDYCFQYAFSNTKLLRKVHDVFFDEVKLNKKDKRLDIHLTVVKKMSEYNSNWDEKQLAKWLRQLGCEESAQYVETKLVSAGQLLEWWQEEIQRRIGNKKEASRVYEQIWAGVSYSEGLLGYLPNSPEAMKVLIRKRSDETDARLRMVQERDLQTIPSEDQKLPEK